MIKSVHACALAFSHITLTSSSQFQHSLVVIVNLLFCDMDAGAEEDVLHASESNMCVKRCGRRCVAKSLCVRRMSVMWKIAMPLLLTKLVQIN